MKKLSLIAMASLCATAAFAGGKDSSCVSCVGPFDGFDVYITGGALSNSQAGYVNSGGTPVLDISQNTNAGWNYGVGASYNFQFASHVPVVFIDAYYTWASGSATHEVVFHDNSQYQNGSLKAKTKDKWGVGVGFGSVHNDVMVDVGAYWVQKKIEISDVFEPNNPPTAEPDDAGSTKNNGLEIAAKWTQLMHGDWWGTMPYWAVRVSAAAYKAKSYDIENVNVATVNQVRDLGAALRLGVKF